MNLGKAFDSINIETNLSAKTEIKSLHYDSRYLQQGGAFFAIPGFKTDGRKYIPQAVRNGASVVVVEKRDGISTKYSDILILPDL